MCLLQQCMQVASFLKCIHKHILCTMTIEQHIKFVALTILSTPPCAFHCDGLESLSSDGAENVHLIYPKWSYPKDSSVYEASIACSCIQYSTYRKVIQAKLSILVSSVHSIALKEGPYYRYL